MADLPGDLNLDEGKRWLSDLREVAALDKGERLGDAAARRIVGINSARRSWAEKDGDLNHLLAVLAFDAKLSFDPTKGTDSLLARLAVPDISKSAASDWAKVLKGLREGTVVRGEVLKFGVRGIIARMAATPTSKKPSKSISSKT